MFVFMTIKELYRNYLLKLQKIYSLSEATTITDMLFEKLASVTRTGMIKNPAMQPGSSVIKQLDQHFEQLLLHKPVQYVLGEAWFYHLKFKVNEHVLIPRPETEELVEQLIKDRKSKLTDPAILDIGTGSGCIPVAIKKHLPAAVMLAIDVSEKALLLAKENAALHNAHISFLLLDFLNEKNWDSLPLLDIIISNPPYIPFSEKEKLDKNVTAYEPHLALFVPDGSPLVFYQKIAAFGRMKLKPKGTIYLETHEELAKEVAGLFMKDYQTVMIKKDMYGKERMVLVTA